MFFSTITPCKQLYNTLAVQGNNIPMNMNIAKDQNSYKFMSSPVGSPLVSMIIFIVFSCRNTTIFVGETSQHIQSLSALMVNTII